jgi:hypothetical protein
MAKSIWSSFVAVPLQKIEPPCEQPEKLHPPTRPMASMTPSTLRLPTANCAQ